jgi:hypothetical protein
MFISIFLMLLFQSIFYPVLIFSVLNCTWPYLAVVKHMKKWIKLNRKKKKQIYKTLLHY